MSDPNFYILDCGGFIFFPWCYLVSLVISLELQNRIQFLGAVALTLLGSLATTYCTNSNLCFLQWGNNNCWRMQSGMQGCHSDQWLPSRKCRALSPPEFQCGCNCFVPSPLCKSVGLFQAPGKVGTTGNESKPASAARE